MKPKVARIGLVLMLIISIICIQMPIAYADLVGGAQSESGPLPPPPTPSDDPGGAVDPTPPTTTETIETETINYYETISGNVYENIGMPDEYEEINPNNTVKPKIPIPKILVQLVQNGSVIQQMYTDAEGNYSFSPPDGVYSIRFVYGDVRNNIESLSKEEVEQILKYNGHDYYTLELPDETKTPKANTVETEIIMSGKGCAQVVLAIDCSLGMRNTKVEVNGVEKSRLQIAAESAAKLIDSLLDSGENIYISTVFFSGTSYISCGLTKNRALLKQRLNDIVINGWQTPNTDIYSALEKSQKAFVDIENTNKYIIILSDGIPTKVKEEVQVYNGEPAQDTLYKLKKQIAPATKQKVEEVLASGTNIYSLFVKSDDNEENELVDFIFNIDGTWFNSAKDGAEIVEAITKKVNEELKKIISTTQKEYTEENVILAGFEDEERRNQVTHNFYNKTFYNNVEHPDYVKTELFRQIENYNSKENAKQLSELTYMTATGGSNYAIQKNPYGNGYTEEIKDGSGKVVKRIVHVSTGYFDKDMVLARAPTLSLDIKVTATGFKMTLSDGRVFSIKTAQEGEKLPFIQDIDAELVHGATVQVEYTISISNNSSAQCNHLELINYFPIEYQFAEDEKLITVDETNSQYGWKRVHLEDLYQNGYITEDTKNKYTGNNAARLVLDNNGQGENGFFISANGKYKVKIVLSTVIGDLGKFETESKDAAEILGYKNQYSRRMEVMQNATNFKFRGLYPGDSIDKDFAESSNGVVIIPPTGADKKNYVAIIVCMISIIGIVLIIQKERKNNRK